MSLPYLQADFVLYVRINWLYSLVIVDPNDQFPCSRQSRYLWVYSSLRTLRCGVAGASGGGGVVQLYSCTVGRQGPGHSQGGHSPHCWFTGKNFPHNFEMGLSSTPPVWVVVTFNNGYSHRSQIGVKIHSTIGNKEMKDIHYSPHCNTAK